MSGTKPLTAGWTSRLRTPKTMSASYGTVTKMQAKPAPAYVRSRLRKWSGLAISMWMGRLIRSILGGP